ncbi:DMT family transporter [Paenibacillus physcomitrellae]|uniref:Membrane protein n=1 Tax=Paenibacillus physcomitrellae TaxID=1619311 RepID=A0ABQ1FQB6_9BACL|nr:DMT family transporter [Paenibacillus physcomitrellae]GGA24058.1 membrane protein [Paenibacillus physcomitrellae]
MNRLTEGAKIRAVKVRKTAFNFHLAAAVIAVLLWSTSFVGTKLAYQSFPPLTVGAARFAVASVILGVLLVLRKEFYWPPLKDLGWMALSGLLGITLYFSLENIGLGWTSASSAALIVASYPAITLLLEFIFFRIRTSWIKGLGIITAIAGVYVVTGGSVDGGIQSVKGNLILVAAGVVFAAYNFSTRKVVGKYSMVTVSFYQNVSGTLSFIPLAWFEHKQWVRPNAQAVWMIVYLGLFCSVAAFMLYNYGLRRLHSGTAVALLNLVPVFGVLFSSMFLHEALHATDWIGGFIILAGVILSVTEKRKKPGSRRDQGEIPDSRRVTL